MAAHRLTLVLGLGESGLAMARWLARQGVALRVADSRPVPPGIDRLKGDAPAAELVTGPFADSLLDGVGRIAISPGLDPRQPLVESARARGIPVVGEMDLLVEALEGHGVRDCSRIIAITGTNGKTTTTTLAGELFRANGFSTYVGGNIGDPLIDLPASGEPVERAVAEISSFQLEWISSFRPKVAALLNITEDHLDRYPSYQAYINAKLRIFENQTADDFAVVNRDDELVWQAAQSLKAQLFPFSRRHELTEGIFSREGELLFRHHGQELSIPTAGFRLQGVHNLENIMAALACCLLLGCQRETSLELLNRFEALHHRMEFVREVADVRYFEDSKATNVGSVAKALESFENITLIAGGKDKGGSYAPLAELVQQRVRHLVLIGEAAERMQQELGDLTATHKAATLEEAVQLSADLTAPGGVVLLSPACSSFDMFKDYEERAQRFITAVKRL